MELDEELAGIAPIYRGRLQPIGQIGALVRFPQGLVDLIGAVRMVGIAELAAREMPIPTSRAGDRWLEVELIGEVDAVGEFRRGVGTYPGLDDAVNFAVPETLAAVFPAPGPKRIRLGGLSAAPEIPVCADIDRLVLRHTAVVGSTGAGKTSAVARLLQLFGNGRFPGANIVVVDVHGEYGPALENSAAIRRVLPDSGSPSLRIPFWALAADEVLRAFTGTPVQVGPAGQRWRQLVTEARQEFAAKAKWLEIEPAAITADSPIPFDIREVWLRFDDENRETRDDKADPQTVRVKTAGNAQTLIPTEFETPGAGSIPPHQGPAFGQYGSVPERLRRGLRDPQLAFLGVSIADAYDSDPLPEAAAEWLGGDASLSVLDFSGVPGDVADLAIGVVVGLLLDLALRSDEVGIGRPRPVLLVLEEAHRYLGADASAATRDAVNRIAREGRKYGVGLMLVTQRPSELPETALAQCGTLIALRLTNGSDQNKVRSALPDTVAGLADVLPSLRTGEAVVSGEAVALPARVLVDAPDPPPAADDPGLGSWITQLGPVDLTQPIAEWRGAYEAAADLTGDRR